MESPDLLSADEIALADIGIDGPACATETTVGRESSAAPPRLPTTDGQAQQSEPMSMSKKKEVKTAWYQGPDERYFRRIVRNFTPS